MKRKSALAALAAFALLPATPASAQFSVPPALLALAGTRLDISATGEVSRIPDVVRVTAGVSTQAPTAGEALRQNAALMERVRAALARAGIADRDVQTESLALSAVYRNNAYPRDQITGYAASNDLIIRFRDVSGAGPVLDALVAAGVTEIRGPMLGFENPEAARDEARGIAIATARERAQLYARALGMRVKRVVAVTEPGQFQYGSDAVAGVVNFQGSNASTTIDPGGRRLTASVNVTFELE
jgi:uncharacterized protein YggE